MFGSGRARGRPTAISTQPYRIDAVVKIVYNFVSNYFTIERLQILRLASSYMVVSWERNLTAIFPVES